MGAAFCVKIIAKANASARANEHGHGAAVVVDVVAALEVGEDLNALDEAGGVGRGRGRGLVPSVFLTRKAILLDSGSTARNFWSSAARFAAR